MKLIELTEGLKLTPAMRNELQFFEVDTYDEEHASESRTAIYNWLVKHPRGGNVETLSDEAREGLIRALDNAADALGEQGKKIAGNMKNLQHALEKIK